MKPKKLKLIPVNNRMVEIRIFGEYTDKAFWLSNIFDWRIRTESNGNKVLIPTKKKGSKK